MNSPADPSDSAVVDPSAQPAAASEAAASVPAVEAASSQAPDVAAMDAPTAAPEAKKEGAPPVQAANSAPEVKSNAPHVSGSLVPFIAAQRAEASRPPKGASFWRVAYDRRLQLGAAAAALAVLGIVSTAAISYGNQQAYELQARSAETQNLEETLKGLKARLAALETARRDEVADLRKAASEAKNGLGAAHDANATLAQLNARLDHLEHDSAARTDKLGERVDHDAAAHIADINARLEKLGERIDHDAATRNADFTARLDRIEKKLAAPVVAALPLAPPAPAAAPKTAAATPAPGPGVSKETTGSIAPARAPIHGWVVRNVRDGVAIVEGRYGFQEVVPGDFLPGAGRVERIERRGAEWTVVTNIGVIGGAPEADF